MTKEVIDKTFEDFETYKALVKYDDLSIDKERSVDAIFSFTIPYWGILDLMGTNYDFMDIYLSQIKELLEKYKIDYTFPVDTKAGWFNLDQPWLETSVHTPIKVTQSYSGAFPIEWSEEDIIKLKFLIDTGKVICMVAWIEGEDFIPNH
ncbi:hypothetical protein MKA27_19595 [[Clostridium] innocuum]|uniref:hypothetical protein n=1 Tax=Clostridium innocuum TaxID=1522 RepID=UPI000D6AD3F2|nr:hypothetical protein [[Clostridium] innocuum]MCR0316595.1 hypothetical protein [[Clostridium] innocuum]MCR0371939.1 hypothetical protein [[Clostridium] innocuum]MCR0375994.1 hypothetical protein [[Clostridium] innocuum]MCR0561245.1 hypothetical protein [[Clostridium] innocuum]MCR0604549.1 hypothetical protein [[Clostridium] innocuum]